MTERHAGDQEGVRHTRATDAESHRFQARFFGPFHVSRDGAPLNDAAELGRTSARTLLKWFLLNPGIRVGSLELCELLWPVRRSRSNPNRLHVTLHYLRHLLEPDLAARQPSTFIRSDGKGLYWFDFADSWWTDVRAAERLLAAGKDADTKGDVETAITSYELVLDYYRRTFLPENLFDEAFDSSRTAYDVAHRDVESRLLRLYLVRGQIHKALPIALSVLERDPYSEEASTAIAEVNLRQGNVLAARTQFARYLETIRRELGADPSGSALRLWERIQRAG
ncbi:BTAD domain-containing putative transcriptional regulator [Nocardia sp. CDC153]|uniref:AfsR/SARP family transcriptional regulator n=1 Tax=Nocardia sp. CDC153 TaxID=3112167 RepID=UPI002DB5755E|nr:BTAD domain-containing putative transcriptional regulator [Nocardia sp. CDC153]MEC3957778.1 BTAD domain-containing putative transcriptional regulator [Nocardia sp. CDC153]